MANPEGVARPGARRRQAPLRARNDVDAGLSVLARRIRRAEQQAAAAADGVIERAVAADILGGNAARFARRRGAPPEEAARLASVARRRRATRLARRIEEAQAAVAQVTDFHDYDARMADIIMRAVSNSSKSRMVTALGHFWAFLFLTADWADSLLHGDVYTMMRLSPREVDLVFCRFATMVARRPATQRRMIALGNTTILADTVSSYCSDVKKFWRQVAGVQWHKDDFVWLPQLIEGLRRGPNQRHMPKFHISPRLIHEGVTNALALGTRFGIVIALLISFLYLLGLRVGEATVTPDFPAVEVGGPQARHLMFEDVGIVPQGSTRALAHDTPPEELLRILEEREIVALHVSIKTSKTSQGVSRGGAALAVFAAPGHVACACTLVRTLLLRDLRAGIDPRGKTFFAFADGRPLTAAAFRPALREAFHGCRDEDGTPLDPHQIVPHALRGSAATTLVLRKCGKLLLEICARWRRDTEHRYIRFKVDLFRGLAAALLAFTARARGANIGMAG